MTSGIGVDRTMADATRFAGLLVLALNTALVAPNVLAAASPTASSVTEAAAPTPHPDAANARGETMEDILDERLSPLDQIDQSIIDTEYDNARIFLESYIRAIESAHHRYHEDLVRPLTQLGDIEMGRGNPLLAVEHYGRAVHVNRVSAGLHAPDQVPLVYKEAVAYRVMGNLTEANNREEYAFDVLQRVYGTYSEDILPGIYRLADWYGSNYKIFAARNLYERAVLIYEHNEKQDAVESIRALEGIARTYRLERFPPVYVSSSRDTISNPAVTASNRTAVHRQQLTINNFPAGERALQRIIQIRQSQSDGEPMDVLESMLDLADWHLMFERYRRAFPLYEHVYKEIDKLGGDAAAFFGEPMLLHFPVPADPKPPAVNKRDKEQAGFVDLSFRISSTGRVENMEMLASQPEGLMDFRVRKAMKIARYRPVLVEGVPNPYEDYRFRHDFRYFPHKNHQPAPEVPADATDTLAENSAETTSE
ncbi:MAG: energy transducer TonB [Pseudomonadales bacterium]|nr:energy transducer TonB [Pseudomonadales bacterium]MDP6826364.1 energy transducer TonB [Pseudomonadales bacterium]MDP6973294.1 energy transducer TonB [Pseudomonadales bacterium]